jgi:hypothetical protein
MKIKCGDLVLVSMTRFTDRPTTPKVGIILAERKYPMVGYVVRTLVEGEIREVLREDILKIPPALDRIK